MSSCACGLKILTIDKNTIYSNNYYDYLRDIKLLVRSCGKTQTSTNLRLFLKHLNEELDFMFAVPYTETASDFQTLKNTFPNRLVKASLNNQLVIVLDGLENIKSKFFKDIHQYAINLFEILFKSVYT